MFQYKSIPEANQSSGAHTKHVLMLHYCSTWHISCASTVGIAALNNSDVRWLRYARGKNRKERLSAVVALRSLHIPHVHAMHTLVPHTSLKVREISVSSSGLITPGNSVHCFLRNGDEREDGKGWGGYRSEEGKSLCDRKSVCFRAGVVAVKRGGRRELSGGLTRWQPCACV